MEVAEDLSERSEIAADDMANVASTMQLVTQPRVGVIGTGYWGQNLVRNFHELQALAAVCDSDQGRLRVMADRSSRRAGRAGRAGSDRRNSLMCRYTIAESPWPRRLAVPY